MALSLVDVICLAVLAVRGGWMLGGSSNLRTNSALLYPSYKPC